MSDLAVTGIAVAGYQFGCAVPFFKNEKETRMKASAISDLILETWYDRRAVIVMLDGSKS